ncbi:hypothetical protein C2W62_20335 [Candidatus Entotheonella serta]|nr:hypothetical protein C2W62_20335 [Candidatus Entotheonella serta]
MGYVIIFNSLSEGDDKRNYAEAFLAAADELEATSFQLNLVKRSPLPGDMKKGTSITGNRPAIEALKSADLVIDLVGLLWSAEQNEITQTGTRMLMVREPIDVLQRMFPRRSLSRRVEAAQDMLAAATELHITSPAGTNVAYQLGPYPVLTQYGYTDTPGRWDHFAGGFLYTGARDDGVDGVVVINTGDILFPFLRYVNEPVRLEIEKGMVTRIRRAWRRSGAPQKLYRPLPRSKGLCGIAYRLGDGRNRSVGVSWHRAQCLSSNWLRWACLRR